MEKLERVIYDLERCTCHVPDACRDCSKYGSETGLKCMENLMMDALELLKEQEPQNVVVKCEPSNGNILWFANCPKCGQGIERDKHKNHCGYCGQAVKWE